MIESDKTPNAQKNQAEIDKILAEMQENPEDFGFQKMFAHIPPIKVVIVGVTNAHGGSLTLAQVV